MRQHHCMLPKELTWEVVAPPQNRMDTAGWPEPHNCKAFSIMLGIP